MAFMQTEPEHLQTVSTAIQKVSSDEEQKKDHI